MEAVHVYIDDGVQYDAILEQSRRTNVPQVSDIKLVTKRGGTTSGKPIVAVAFTVQIAGENVDVQAVTTVALLLASMHALKGAHEDEIGL